MSDTWSDIQAIKSKRSSFRERLQQRKKERENIVLAVTGNVPVEAGQNSVASFDSSNTKSNALSQSEKESAVNESLVPSNVINIDSVVADDQANSQELEEKLLVVLCDVALNLPVDSRTLVKQVSKALGLECKVSHVAIENLLQKLSAQELIKVKESLNPEGETCLVVSWADHTKLQAVSNEYSRKSGKGSKLPDLVLSKKRNIDALEVEPTDIGLGPLAKASKHTGASVLKDGSLKVKEKNYEDSIESLLSLPSAREKENKKVGAEILELLSKPTAKEKSLVERFRSQGGAQVQEFCPHGIKEECKKVAGEPCKKLHFKKIIQKHTDEALGDCSFLNTCFHMDTCKYVHYEVDYSTTAVSLGASKGQGTKGSVAADDRLLGVIPGSLNGDTVLYPTQWIQCDLRFFDMSILGKFAVIMADPPWDIHMELPYGTMSDDEMRQLNVPGLQDEGLIFLWVTGRAMELGRECLRLWGYTRCDEIIWVKTNQLQRIIRTGRTGHWLNHGKEHCLVGVKGNVEKFNRGLDCDVIVAEVRATSHKPDEIYGIIERLSPGTRKIELFGRPHNVQPNWMTLGNQLDGVRLHDPALIEAFNSRYPDQNCMKKPD